MRESCNKRRRRRRREGRKEKEAHIRLWSQGMVDSQHLPSIGVARGTRRVILPRHFFSFSFFWNQTNLREKRQRRRRTRNKA
jgi:hypothetical protein